MYKTHDLMESKLKYTSVKMFMEDYPDEYRVAYNKGYIPRLCDDMHWRYPVSLLTFEKCKIIASEYNSKPEWKLDYPESYRKASDSGWMPECSKHMGLTLEKCKIIASEYNSKPEWKRGNSKSYRKASDSGWMPECSKHMGLTLEKCKIIAGGFLSKPEWKLGEPDLYRKASESGWIDECSKDFGTMIKKETILLDALKYKTINSWLEKSEGLVSLAYASNWFTECTKHMVPDDDNLFNNTSILNYDILVKKLIK